MNSEYGRGYFKAVLDLLNLFETIDQNPAFRLTLKQYKRMVLSFLKLLAEDSYIRDLFREYGGLSFDSGRAVLKQKPDGTMFAEYRS